jgi:hypothetical protein
MHKLLACAIVATFCMPPAKIVSITSAATRMTTAVTTMMMVVDSPFIHKLWWRSFKNLLHLVPERGRLLFEGAAAPSIFNRTN